LSSKSFENWRAKFHLCLGPLTGYWQPLFISGLCRKRTVPRLRADLTNRIPAKAEHVGCVTSDPTSDDEHASDATSSIVESLRRATN
jgi:hypothetical protein